MRLLMVEDEDALAGPLRSALEQERHVVDHVDRLSMAREAVRIAAYDLVLLDRTLPDGDGLTLLPELRASFPGLPVIIISARGEVPDRIAGLDEGADDYLIKPFAIDEMLARVRAVRRRPAGLIEDRVHAGRLVFDLAHESASIGEQRLDLPRRELQVLAVLMRRRGRTVLRESLEQAVFGFDDDVQSNTLDSHISRLRRKLADMDARVEIQAVRGVGYFLRDAL